MYEKRLRGVVIPTVTPMNEDGSIDEASLINYTRFLADAGVDALYPNGTNGESLLLTEAERKCIAETVAKENKQRLPLYIQCGSMTTAETVSHSKHAAEMGADGIGIMSPAFFSMDEEALLQYYSEVIRELPADFPVYIYNIPGCTTNDVKPVLLEKLMGEFSNIIGIKFSSSDMMRLQDYLETGERKPDLLIGCDRLFLHCLVSGGVGTVTGPGAIFHERFTRLYRQYQEGDYDGAAKTQNKIIAMDREMAGIPGIPALKTLLKLRGVIRTDICRAPLRALSEKEKHNLHEIYIRYCEEEGINE